MGVSNGAEFADGCPYPEAAAAFSGGCLLPTNESMVQNLVFNCNTDGQHPNSTLQAADGRFYGFTVGGSDQYHQPRGKWNILGHGCRASKAESQHREPAAHQRQSGFDGVAAGTSVLERSIIR